MPWKGKIQKDTVSCLLPELDEHTQDSRIFYSQKKADETKLMRKCWLKEENIDITHHIGCFHPSPWKIVLDIVPDRQFWRTIIFILN